MQEDSIWNFGPLEVEIHMEHSDKRRRLPCELDTSCTSATAESRAKILYQQSTFKAPQWLRLLALLRPVVVDFFVYCYSH